MNLILIEVHTKRWVLSVFNLPGPVSGSFLSIFSRNCPFFGRRMSQSGRCWDKIIIRFGVLSKPFSIIGHFRQSVISDYRVISIIDSSKFPTFHNIFFRHFYFIRYYQWVYYYCFCLFIYFIFARGTGQQQQPARQNVFRQCFARPSRFRSTQHLLLQSFTGKLCINNAQGVDYQDTTNLVRTSIRSAVRVGRRSYYNKW